ncbi:cupin domain-containing protein [Azospirillum griseum]|uniref:Cupin domain-containing protein n=1 Tax=Azospirillum griseum TaxID=2496639 RepID=A0A3S0I2M4_9PROT|nr:cupin domain-containing protein [Azospirillum griseum]
MVVFFSKTLNDFAPSRSIASGAARHLGGLALALVLACGVVGGARAHGTHDDDHHQDGPLAAQVAQSAGAVTSTLLLETSTHGDGVPIVYPKGTPLITARITQIPPGAVIPKHRHPIPLFVYMLEGELTLHVDNGTIRVAKEGEAFMEASNWHYGQNAGTKTVRLLAVYPGEVGAPLSVRAPDPASATAPGPAAAMEPAKPAQ